MVNHGKGRLQNRDGHQNQQALKAATRRSIGAFEAGHQQQLLIQARREFKILQFLMIANNPFQVRRIR